MPAPKVSITPEKFDALIQNQGVRVKVYQTVPCPRVKSIDGSEHDIDCPLCHGSQFLDHNPKESLAHIQNQQLEKLPYKEGLYDGNTVVATFQSGVELQYFALIELCDFTEAYFQRIKRQTGSLDVLKYKASQVNLLVDGEGRQYYEGSDFRLDANGNVSWQANKGPLAGSIYSIHYNCSVKFRAIKAHHANRFAQITQSGKPSFVKLPESWLLNKSYLVERKDVDGQVIEPNKIREADDDSDLL